MMVNSLFRNIACLYSRLLIVHNLFTCETFYPRNIPIKNNVTTAVAVINHNTTVTEIIKTNYTDNNYTTIPLIITVTPLPVSSSTSILPLITTPKTINIPMKWTKIITVDRTEPIIYNSGYLANVGEFPWHIYIVFTFYEDESKYKYCAGAILSKETAVTTAACFFDESGVKFTLAEIHVGNIESENPYYTYRLNVTKHTRIHTNFKIENPYLNNNIALIYFPIHLVFSSVIHEIEIAQFLPSDPDPKIHMIGFGRSENNSTRQSLKYYSLKLNQLRYCSIIYGPNVCNYQVITTFGKDNRRSTICRVESGAPISYHKRPKFMYNPKLIALAGAVSEFGCEQGYPDVHTNIIPFRDWIHANM